MDTAPATFEPCQREAVRLTSRLLSRDGLSAFPELISQAAAARLRAGLRVIEAFLARLLVLMALEIESTLTHVERPERRPRERQPRKRGVTLRIFPCELVGDGPELSLSESWPGSPNGSPPERPAAAPAPVPTRALFERLARLRLIAEAPGARARRLAFHMARTRPGPLLAPKHRPGVANRWGVEASALYTAMGQGIVTASRSRPPPLPPPRVPRPIITRL